MNSAQQTTQLLRPPPPELATFAKQAGWLLSQHGENWTCWHHFDISRKAKMQHLPEGWMLDHEIGPCYRVTMRPLAPLETIISEDD